MSVKASVLALLSESEGKYLGGEEMARELGCSRAAIWKAIGALKQEGHQIESVQAVGYRLVSLQKEPTREGISLWREDKEAQVKVYPSLPSTNQTAKEAYVAGEARHGAVFVALEQSAGRGHLGRVFYSPRQAGVYFSIVLEPRCSLEKAQLITVAAATAVYRAVRKVCGIELSIKWVNDLYKGDRKVAGILSEAVTDFESGFVQAVIVGIGINLYPPRGGYPEELQGKAGALLEGEEENLDQSRLIAEVANELLALSRLEQVPKEYIERNIVPGREVLVEGGGKGVALSITGDGGLLVRLTDGQERVLRRGEVKILDPAKAKPQIEPEA